jgi:hypothetical protein
MERGAQEMLAKAGFSAADEAMAPTNNSAAISLEQEWINDG